MGSLTAHQSLHNANASTPLNELTGFDQQNGFIDTLTLSNDGNTLDGMNAQSTRVFAARMGTSSSTTSRTAQCETLAGRWNASFGPPVVIREDGTLDNSLLSGRCELTDASLRAIRCTGKPVEATTSCFRRIRTGQTASTSSELGLNAVVFATPPGFENGLRQLLEDCANAIYKAKVAQVGRRLWSP